MSDNTILNASTVPGGDKISTDELTQINGAAAESGLKVQRVKVGFGPDGSLQDVTDAAPLPVAGSLSVSNFPAQTGLTDTELRAAPVPVQDAESSSLLGRILRALLSPLGYDFSLQRYRQTAVVESGTVTTVTTVTTVATMTNAANIGGIQAQLLVNGQNLAAWQASVRSRIT